jgi:hypothetical protein
MTIENRVTRPIGVVVSVNDGVGRKECDDGHLEATH